MSSSVYPKFVFPNQEFIRKKAKQLKKLILEKDTQVTSWYQQSFPDINAKISLQKIQHILAVECGFKSWTELVRHTTPLEYPKALHSFQGEDKRLKAWPVKRSRQVIFLELIASRIRPGIIYSEKQFNTVLNCYHSFNDPARLRRDMLGCDMIKRKADGSEYSLK
jgi:hypothetical protein